MKGLIVRYYAIYVFLLALFAAISYFVPQIELTPDNAYIVSVVCIFFVFTIPATLKLFSVKTKGNKKLKTKEEKEAKKQVEGQFDLFDVKFSDISRELDKINVNELTPIEALNTLVKLKDMIK